jgi:hypothetical protein
VNRAIFRRLFLLYATSSLCFAGSFLRRFMPTFIFYVFYYMALICLTDYRLVFNRRREFGHITTCGSGYEGIGHQRALALAPPLIAPSLRSAAIHSSAASPVLLRRLFYPLDSSCLRDLLLIGFFMFERFIIDWILHV